MNDGPQTIQPKRGPFPLTKESRSWTNKPAKSTFILTEKEIEKFWQKVNKDGPLIIPDLGNCWTWGKNANRYPCMVIRGECFAASRIACAIAVGPVTSCLVVACHKCDYPPCVRPDHLFLGTHCDNAQDRLSKGRSRNGYGVILPRNQRSKVTL